jgi:2-polyprenyl-6-methoxyphenol hydroxylase-like FAD-dependent oxidoreductase
MALDRAVVIGGSIAGLAAAATLSGRAREVVLVERRAAPALPPQAGLPHAMLASGALVLHGLFRDLGQRLRDRGAAGGPDPTRVPCYWAAAGAVRHELRFPDLGITRAFCSRSLIQHELSTSVAGIPNVRREQDTVTGVVVEEGAVRGVILQSGRAVEADLVVDAGGRDGGVPPGGDLPEPPTSDVGVDIRYSAFIVERRPHDLDGAALAVVQNTPDIPRVGIALPMEGDRWQIGFGTYFGQPGPTGRDETRAFAAEALADPILASLLDRPLLDAPQRYRFRVGQRRHWERLTRPIPGYVAVGDSVASFNPVYGQGMSSALLQVRELGRQIDRHGAGPALATSAPKAIARVVDGPWQISTGADLGYARTVGARPRGQMLINGYVARVLRAAAVDDRVNLAFTSVSHLLAPPSALFAPPILARVLRHGSAAARSIGRTGVSGRGTPSPPAAGRGPGRPEGAGRTMQAPAAQPRRRSAAG